MTIVSPLLYRLVKIKRVPKDETMIPGGDGVDSMTVRQKIQNFPLYLKHQVLTLQPPEAKPMNPVTWLRLLNRRQCEFFILAFLGWSWVRPFSM